MKALLDGRALAIDIESTGVDVHSDRIVTACAALIEGGRVMFQRDWLVNPGVDIPQGATDVHGVTTEKAHADGIPAEQGVREFANAVRYALDAGYALVAFNAAFDLSMLNAECERYGLGLLEEHCGRKVARVVDPLTIDRAVDRFRKGGRTLGDVCGHYAIVLEDAHTADADAVAAARVAYRLAQRSQMPAEQLVALYGSADLRGSYGYRHNPAGIAAAFEELGRYDLDGLHDRQVAWYAEQVESRGDFWSKKAHAARLTAEQATQRVLDADDPTVRDEADQERAAAEAEADDLEQRIATLNVEWPIRTLPVAVAS